MTYLRHNQNPLQYRLWFLFFFLVFVFCVFFLTPALRPSSLLTVLNVLLLAPIVTFLEKKKVPRTTAVLSLLALGGVIVIAGFVFFFKKIVGEWSQIASLAPQMQDRAVERFQNLLEWARVTLHLELELNDLSFVKHITTVSQKWILEKAPAMAGDFATALIFAPIFTFFILRDTRDLQKQLLVLVPNEFFESFYTVTKRAGAALSQFLRAKIYEAILLGLMTTAGLYFVGAPNALVFGIVAGIFNLIPYLGPVLGVIPVVLFLGMSEGSADKVVPSVIVLLIANIIDAFYVFPVFVGRLVNLSVLTMLAAVAVGQELYGLIGMLVAVPLASCAKILFQEIYQTLYRQRLN